MILNALVLKLKREARGDFSGRHFEAALIIQAVSWYLRYALSYRDIEEMFLEHGLEVNHSTINRWVLTYAPLIERRLRTFRKPHCGSVRIDETYVRIRGQWRYLYRAVDKHAPFWTMTAWNGEDSMRRSMPASAHRIVMPRLLDWCDEASVVHWTQPESAFPAWGEADLRMRESGRPSKVRNPSAQHATMTYRAPRLTGAGPTRPSLQPKPPAPSLDS